jgi:hypothetical protein
MVEALIAAGTPAALAATIVAEAFAAGAQSGLPQTSRDSNVTSRKETDRLRQQRWRDRNATSRDNRDNSVTSRDAPLSKDSIEVIEKKEESKKEKERERASRVTTVTSRDDWRPSEIPWREAVVKLGEQRATAELMTFRARGREMTDAEWSVWVQRAVDYAVKTAPAPLAAVPSAPLVIDWDKQCAFFKKTRRWSRDFGPDPDSFACKCPPEILEKYGFQSAVDNAKSTRRA